MIMSNMVMDCIHSRRSTREFLPDQIKDEELEMLLEAAKWAPSGGNNQTWLFTAIQSKEKLMHLAKLVREAFLRWTPDDDYPGKFREKKRSENEDHNFFYSVPTLIILSNVPNYQNAMADNSLALQNIFLAAESLGLGSCYINPIHWIEHDVPVREYLATLGIPKEHVITNAAAIGYKGKEFPAPARKENTVNIVR